MDRYKMNYVFENKKDVNEILIKVLNKELREYMNMICKNKKYDISSSCTPLSKEVGKLC